jgi:adenylate cyclase
MGDVSENPDALADHIGSTAGERELIEGLLRLGVQPERIREAARLGRVEEAIFEGVLDPERERRRVSATEIERDGGLPAREIQAMLRGFGLPAPNAEQEFFTSEEADAFRALGRLREIWPQDVRLQVARVYGQALDRIARTELHLFRSRLRPRIEETTPSPLEALEATRQAAELLLPLADPLLLGVHRRKLERELTQAAVWEAELEAEGLVPGTVEVSLLFCDLRHFTSYANRQGDRAAIEVLDHLAEAVEQNIGENGRLVKALGDGYMLAYPTPAPAVAAALAISAAMRPFGGPPLHAGLHHGLAVFREGDYYGRAVNLASRLLNSADGDELLATENVALASEQYGWQRRGRTQLPDFETDLEIFRLDLRSGAS